MRKAKTYYPYFDILRIVSCVAVLFYHFGILKGGYLAVCSFFVLSGYLSCTSAFQKEKFSIRTYYKNRFLKIYLPLIIVVFLTIAIIPFVKDLGWINLKPETTSVLLGYNNFWQLGASLDYFTRHISSPFMHFWYIAILLQFELVFPFVFLLFKKIGEKIGKIVPCILTFLLTIGSMVYFLISSNTQPLMVTYYSTFTRSFSLFLGMFLGFFHSYYGAKIPKIWKQKKYPTILFCFYLLFLTSLFFFIDNTSPLFQIGMILSTLLTCRLIDYGTLYQKKELSKQNEVVKEIAQMSYIIYLVQYPVIFFQEVFHLGGSFQLPLSIIVILLLSSFIHFALVKREKGKILCYILRIILIFTTLFGGYQYVIAKDHTKEMEALEEQLIQNTKIMEERQKEYEKKFRQEQEELEQTLKNLEENESNLENVVLNLPIVGVGDSIMLGATDALYAKFPNSFFDAKKSRTAWEVNGILVTRKNNNLLGDPIIINVGANGDGPESCKIEVMETCEGKEVFWVNVTNDKDVHVNEKLQNFASRYENLHVIDWASASTDHPEYFVADGIHLTEVGSKAYADVIYQNIYQVYYEKYQKQKEEIILKHEEEQKTKVSFYGNDILLNIMDTLQENIKEAKFVTKKDFNYKKLKETLEREKKEDTLNYNIVLAFDQENALTISEYQELMKQYQNHQFYIVSIDKETSDNLSKLEVSNSKIIDFYQEIKKHPNYLMADKIHLTKQGNQKLSTILKDTIFKTKD